MTMTRTFNFNGEDCRTYTIEKEMEIRDARMTYRFSKVKELRDCICEITEKNTGETYTYTMLMHERQVKDMYPNVYERLVLNLN